MGGRRQCLEAEQGGGGADNGSQERPPSDGLRSHPGKLPTGTDIGQGISHALVVTLFGIGISIPAIFFNAFFRNRITKLTMDVGHIADDLLTQMYHNSKKPAAGAPVAAAVAVPIQAQPR